MYDIKVWRDPYGIGVTFTRARTVELKEGLTVLIGCNGSGKTTLLKNIESQCKKEKINVYSYNNLHDGGHHALSSYLFHGDMDMLANTAFRSEGEAISDNLGYQATKFRQFLVEGEEADAATKIFMDEEDYKRDVEARMSSNKRVMLFDAVDSGLSIDQVREVKHLFNMMQVDAKNLGIELYIIVSCNEFELARDEQCIVVTSGKYAEVHTYAKFEKLILQTREIKDRRVYKYDD